MIRAIFSVFELEFYQSSRKIMRELLNKLILFFLSKNSYQCNYESNLEPNIEYKNFLRDLSEINIFFIEN